VWLIALLCLAQETLAQDRPVELGIDGAISYSIVSAPEGQTADNVQTWAFPLQSIRAGLFLARSLQVEVSTGFSVADYGEVSTVRFALGLAGLYHLTGDRTQTGLYLQVGAGLDLLSDEGSDTQWSAGGGVGYKVRLGDQLSLRPAVQLARSFESDGRFAETTISGLVGLSFFVE
jgi:hypothetical protein